MSKKQIITTLIIVAVIGLLAIPKLMPSKDGKSATGKPSGPPPPIKVGVYVVKKMDQQNTLQSVGNVMAEDEVELRTETQGRIVSINFAEGEEVQKGQVLLKINDTDLLAQLKKALSTKKLKQEAVNRNKPLLEKGGISQEAYDISVTDLNSANADIDLLNEQIRKSKVIAPFSGMIGLRSISEGAYINNATVIARLQNIKRVKVEFAIPEKYATLVAIGNEIRFTVEGQSEEFSAKIYAIEPKIDPITRNIVARAICDNPKRKLVPGAFAKIIVTLKNNPDALMIPTQTVVPILKGQKVFVVQGDSVVEHKIEIGSRNEQNVEVINGLSEGDSVVVQGVIQMKQGAKVKVVM